MKLKYKFEIVDLNNGQITAVPIGDNADKLHAILNINDVSANILRILDNTFDYEQVKSKFLSLYPNEKETEVIEALDEFLNKLSVEGILEK